MKYFNSLIFILLFSITCFSQDVTIRSQAEMDAFDPSTTVINGSLGIFSNNPSDRVINLNNLSNLTSIQGYLIIYGNYSLPDIDELSNLISIGGKLTIADNSLLTNINGLSNLISIGGGISIYKNNLLQNIDGLSNVASFNNGDLLLGSIQNIDVLSNLTSLNHDLHLGLYHNPSGANFSLGNVPNTDGLSNLTSIGGNLGLSVSDNANGLSNLISIGGNLGIGGNSQNIDGLSNLTSIGGNLKIAASSFQNIDGLSNLSSINGYIFINNNHSLVNINGLSGITSINSYLRIWNNDALEHVDGLSNLISIGDYSTIDHNASLLHLDGLSNLISVNGNFKIKTNPSLQHIDGLSNLSSVNGDLQISDNSSLSDCCGIKNLLNIPNSIEGSINIYNNPSECSNENEILNTACTLTGAIYVDINATGTNTGITWGNAFTDLQDALSIAQATDTIHIAEGTYLPSQSGTRGSSFDIPTEVTLLGGYPTGGGTANPYLYETILSGNVDNNTSSQGDSYHVIIIKDAIDVEINGLTIRDGNANDASSYGRSRGGGLYINNSTVELIDVEIKWNRAVFGGALFAKFSDITIRQSTFKKNRADNGAAFYYSNATNLNLYHNHIIDNIANNRCALESNNASNTIIENCIFANNKSSNANALGFIATNRNANAQITNSTILGENANKSLISVQIGNNDQMDLTINNSIVAHQDISFDKNIVVYNNNVFNFNHSNCYFSGAGISGNGTNNLFADTAGALQLNADYSLANSSPAVNAGNDALTVGSNDIFGNPRFVGTVDIGAVENQMTPRYMAGNQKEPINKKYDFNVFPNPTKNKIHIETNLENPTVIICDILGQIILQTREKEMDLSQLTQGVYYLNIYHGKEIILIKKVIKI